MVSPQLRALLLRPPKAAQRKRHRQTASTWAPTTPMTVIRGLRMGPTGCVCSLALFDTPRTATQQGASSSTPEVSRRPTREERLVLPELAPRLEVHAAAGDFDAILATRQLPARPLRAIEWPARSTSPRSHARPKVRDVPRLPCPLAATQRCSRCPWMSLGNALSAQAKAHQLASQLRHSLPTFLPHLCSTASASEMTARARQQPRDITLEDTDGDASRPDHHMTTPASAGSLSDDASHHLDGHEGQVQRLPVDYREGAALPLQGNHLQEIYLAFERPASSSPGAAAASGGFHFIPLSAATKDDLTRTRGARRARSLASADTLRDLCLPKDATPPAASAEQDNTETEPTDTQPVADGLPLCGLATLEQKRLLTLLSEWARRLPVATQSCLCGALVLQVPASTTARQAWSSSLLLTLLVEKDVVGWGPQSPLCGPAHPADVLSIMEQELIEAVLAASPLLPDVRVQVGFVGGDGWADAETGVLVGDKLHPIIQRQTALTAAPGETTTTVAEEQAADRIHGDNVVGLTQPLACYVEALDAVIEAQLTVTSSALELYAADTSLVASTASASPAPHHHHHRGAPTHAGRQKHAQAALDRWVAHLPMVPFFRHAAALDTACSVLISALVETMNRPRVWLQLPDWRFGQTHSGRSDETAPQLGVADPRVGCKRLSDALLAVFDVLDTSGTALSRARRWHRSEGRELALRETEGSGVAPIIGRRRRVLSHGAAVEEDVHSPYAVLSLLPSTVEAARLQARSLAKWLTFVEATLSSREAPTHLPSVRVVLAQCTGDGDAAPLLAALDVLCQTGVGLPIQADAAARAASRRLRLDSMSTSAVDVDPLTASCVAFVALDLSLR